MCLYKCALLRTNLYSVTITRVVLTQIRTRHLINNIAFCPKGSVKQPYSVHCFCHCTGQRALCMFGMNLQQKPLNCVWLETMVYLQTCSAPVCVPRDDGAKSCSLAVYAHKCPNKPWQHLGLWSQKQLCCQHAHEQTEDDNSLCAGFVGIELIFFTVITIFSFCRHHSPLVWI